MSADLLIELGCEELPPKALDGIRDALFQGVCLGLGKNNISLDEGASCSYSSPRRLALLLRNVAKSQPSQDLERKGPAVQAAFDADGKPTGAALGFARSVGREVDELEILKTDKGEWLFARVHQEGKGLDELIWPVLEQAIRGLPVPRPMRWSDHEFSFVRPVHWLVVLHGDRVLKGRLLGQEAGQTTRGHRIHAPGPHEIDRSDTYLEVLRKGHVLADQDQRRESIRQMLLDSDANVHIDEELLEEVKNLVEWPVPVVCSFDEEFLDVPHEALIASMQDHQKFFPILANEQSNRVSNRFVSISNVDSLDFNAVREGYERVIRPRLADARFFFEQDRKHGLSHYSPALDEVVFQKKIGSIGDKTRRIVEISRNLAELVGQDTTAITRAASLSKCDLLSLMVGEFPELQGVMGMHYAESEGETAEVALAIGEHYSPRYSGDAIPTTLAGQLIGIADRLDTLVGIFAAGLKPSGNKDPFALRRSALGLCRILIEAELDLSLDELLQYAVRQLEPFIGTTEDRIPEVRDFIVERLRHFYRDQGFSTELVTAALASPWATLPDLDQRIRAIASFMDSEAAISLAGANKRIGNILRKSGQGISGQIDENAIEILQEKVLFEEVKRLELALAELIDRRQYHLALEQLSLLRNPVDEFFDKVMVMDEDPIKRHNRLSLLSRMKALFDQIADLSVLG